MPLPAVTVHALTAVLADIEATANRHGWDAPPAIIALFGCTPVGNCAAITIETRPLPQPVPLAVSLQAFADLLTATFPPQWRNTTRRTFLGFGVVTEAWIAKMYTGYQPGDLNTTPAMADAEARVVSACDIDGRCYQVLRRRGADPSVSIAEYADGTIAGAIIDALYRIVDVARTRT